MPKNVFLVVALLWSATIVFFCLININNTGLSTIENIDKYAHSFFHFVFTILWFLFLKKQTKKTTIFKLLLVAFCFSGFFGIGIEIAQKLFTTTRQADILDVVANTIGAGLAVIVLNILLKARLFNKI